MPGKNFDSSSVLPGGKTATNLIAVLAALVVAGIVGTVVWVSQTNPALPIYMFMIIAGIGLTVLTLRYLHFSFGLFLFLIPVHATVMGIAFNEGLSSVGTSFSLVGALKDLYLILLILVLVYQRLKNRLPVNSLSIGKSYTIPVLIWWLYLLTNLVSMFNSQLLSAGLWGLRSAAEFSTSYILALGLISSSKDLDYYLRWMLAGGAGIFVYGLYLMRGRQLFTSYELVGGSRTFIPLALTPFGHYSTAGIYATYSSLILLIAVTYAVFVRGKSRNFSLMVVGLGLVNMILNFERRSWLGVAFGLVLMLAFSRRSLQFGLVIAFFASLMTAFLLLDPRLSYLVNLRLGAEGILEALTTRTEIFSSYWQDAVNSFLFGQGLGTASNSALSFADYYTLRPHNYYLLLLTEGGIVLLLGFMTAVVYAVFCAVSYVRSTQERLDQQVAYACFTCLGALLVQGLVMDVGDIFPINFYLWFFMGALVALSHRLSQTRSQKPTPIQPNGEVA